MRPQPINRARSPLPNNRARSPLPWLGGLLLCYLAVPIVAFCVRLALTHQRGFHDPGLFSALATSVLAATISTTIVTVVGVPLAYLLARSRGRLASVLGIVVQLPLAVPPVMAGLLLVYVVGPYTPLGRFFDGALTGTLAGIVLAQTFVSAPFLVVSARAALGAVDPALGDVAATLGHGEVGRFWRVYVPVAGPGIRAGMVLAWLRAFGEYGATVVLAYHPTSLPVYTFTEFSATGLPGTVAPTALALGVAVVAVLVSRFALRGWRARVRRGARRPVQGPSPAPSAISAAPALVRSSASPVSFSIDHRLGTFRLEVAHRSRSLRLAVLGPSGSGKSTLLRCLAGLYGSAPGPVAFGSRNVGQVPVERRGVGYVAQGFGLFPHLAVGRQVVFAPDADPDRAAWWLDRMHLAGLEHRYPRQLSGGQRQRVALAQALSRAPAVLLLDEPFSALDTPVRRELQRELRRVQRETAVATVVVTHDPEEAALLADEVLVLSDGRALQRGSVRTVYSRPASPEVARLIGVRNVLRGAWSPAGVVAGHGGIIPAPANVGPFPAGTEVLWSVRPEDVRLMREHPPGLAGDGTAVAGRSVLPRGAALPGVVADPGGAALPGVVADPGGAALPGVVADVADLGTSVEVVVALDAGFALEVRERSGEDMAPGDRFVVGIPSEAVLVWSAAAAPSSDPGSSRQLASQSGPGASPGSALSPGPVAG